MPPIGGHIEITTNFSFYGDDYYRSGVSAVMIEDVTPTAYDLATEELLSKLLKKGVSVHLCPNREEGFDGIAEYKGERFTTYKQPTIGAVAYHLWTQIEKKEMKIQRQGSRKRRRALRRSLRE